jgi:hypothetical protein
VATARTDSGGWYHRSRRRLLYCFLKKTKQKKII